MEFGCWFISNVTIYIKSITYIGGWCFKHENAKLLKDAPGGLSGMVIIWGNHWKMGICRAEDCLDHNIILV